MKIERATRDDYEQICDCDHIATTSMERRGEIAHAIAGQVCYVAWKDHRVVGYSICDHSFFGHAFIAMLMVDPHRRHEGIGMALMLSMEAHCARDKLFTSTNQSNVVMQRLCEKLGFVRSGWIENLDEGDPEIIYFKRLPTHDEGEEKRTKAPGLQ